jgi:hypothetical protein
MNDAMRRLLLESVWDVLDKLENRRPKHPQVAVLRAIHSRLAIDLGLNECPK